MDSLGLLTIRTDTITNYYQGHIMGETIHRGKRSATCEITNNYTQVTLLDTELGARIPCVD